VVGHVDLIGAADRTEVATPVARGVEERDVAPGPVACPQPGPVSVVDHVREPGRGQRPYPRHQARLHRRVVEVVRLARAVPDQAGAAVSGNEQRVGELGLAGHDGGLEDLAQPHRPGPQRHDLLRRHRRLVHLVAVQLGGEGRRLGGGVVDQPDGDVRAGHRVSVELHKTITADCPQMVPPTRPTRRTGEA
jgi:hypothetical protein